jgi:hypothetical protein
VKKFNVWLVFDAPLISHAWSEKAEADAGEDGQGIKPARENATQEEFLSSLYVVDQKKIFLDSL